MSTQFVKIPTEILYSDDLNSDEKLAYAMMLDRRELSKKNKRFYSNKSKDWFIIYNQESMATVLNKTRRTVGKIYAHLEKLNLITRVSRRNASDLIFLPQCEKVSRQNGKKLPNNQTKAKQTKDLQLNTFNTELPQKEEIKPFKNPDAFDTWKMSTMDKMRVGADLMRAIEHFSERSVSKAYQLVELINNARTNIVKTCHLDNKPGLYKYEFNENLNGPLGDKIAHIYQYGPVSKPEEFAKYMMTSLKDFFRKAFGIDRNLRKTQVVMPGYEENSLERVERICNQPWTEERWLPYDQEPTVDFKIPMFKIR